MLLAMFSNADFNGRWDITVPGEQRARAWWLEVNGTTGKFVGAPGGQVDAIENLAIKDGELTFHFDRKRRREDAETQRHTWRARLVGGRIEGDYLVDGQHRLKWTGKRAPEITDKDDGSWVEGEPVALFNGKDLSGWLAVIPGRELGWEVKDGVMSNRGGANNLVSEQKFWNFKLRMDYRVGKGSNSGLGLRGRYEIQILEDYGHPASDHGNGAIYNRIAPTVNASKAPGEWQTFDVRLVGRIVTVALNGTTIIDRREIEGLTAIAINPKEGEPGPIVLQGDHGPVEVRSIVVTPLKRR
jgi:hypothetical protein